MTWALRFRQRQHKTLEQHATCMTKWTPRLHYNGSAWRSLQRLPSPSPCAASHSSKCCCTLGERVNGGRAVWMPAARQRVQQDLFLASAAQIVVAGATRCALASATGFAEGLLHFNWGKANHYSYQVARDRSHPYLPSPWRERFKTCPLLSIPTPTIQRAGRAGRHISGLNRLH